MKKHLKLALATVFAAGALAVTATSASADIACNREGECWHVRHHYAYRPEFGVVVHPNTWTWGTGEHYVWREHVGRGYWHNGIWLHF